ncbi:MAG: InlB B-repeat-containing protein [Candidatus Izemoplasmatales bacterium]|nr:InlB B-repeat-containing protein [Candidatus Izemoplasmatales bacterium]
MTSSDEITYANLGGMIHDNPDSYTIETPTVTLTDPTSKSGYTFVGWFTALSGGSQVSNITLGSMGNKSLYARWSPDTYTITYENLKLTTTSSPTSYTVETETISLLDPTSRTGYVFMGWYTELEGGTKVTSIELGSVGNKLFYARWTPLIYELSFNVNGGEAIAPLVVTYDGVYSLPEPTKDGYTFAGWTYEGDAFADGIWALTENITISALWTQWPLIVFAANGGSAVQSISQAPGSVVVEPMEPTRTGYTFGGWYDDDNCTNEFAFVTMPSESMTVYAMWTINTYTITYHNLEGSTTSNPTSYSVETPTISIQNPSSRTGYQFAGWYTALEGGTKVSEIGIGSTGDKVLYAKWTAIIYTITFDIDGNLSSLSLPYDSMISLEDIPTISTKANYDLTSPYWDNNPVNHHVTGNYTFTAVYVGNPMTVSYNTGGGSLMGDDIVNYGSLLAQRESPSRSGYHFLAWYADSELAVLYDFNDPVDEVLTLYAAWELVEYTWNIESKFLREDLDNATIVVDDPDQNDIQFQIVNLYYGMDVSPVQDYEGYEFDYFVLNGVEYANIEQLITVEGNLSYEDRIIVYYRKIILTITFSQNPELFNLTPEDIDEPIVLYRVYYNGTFSIANAPVLRGESESIHVVWDRTLFVNIKNDISVYAIYYMTGVKTVTFVDRSVIKYIASAIDDLGNPITGVIGNDSLLWNLYRPGFKFLGWFTTEEGGTKIIQGDLLFADFGAGMTTLYAHWETLTPFTAPTNLDVEATEDEIIITWEVNPALINGFPPAGFQYILNNRLIEDLATEPSRNDNIFTLTLLPGNPDFVLFADLLDPGYHQLSIRALGDDQNHYHGDFSSDYIFSIESIFDGDPTAVNVYDYFIIESFGATNRYIFYTNLEYQFGSNYNFEIVTGQEFAVANQNRIVTNSMSGSFKFRMIKEGQPTVVYDALVVHDVKQFTYGTNYQNYLQATDPELNVLLEEASVYHVGSSNNFYVDLRMINNQGSRIPLAQSILDYELWLFVSGDYQLIDESDLEDYLEIYVNNEMKFKSLAEGETFKLVVKPKYQSHEMTVPPLEFVFKVNDGVNVFNNQQLKTYFSDFDVATINIHASFKAELSSIQKNADGSPKNYRPTSSGQATGNVYQRYSTTIDDDQLTVEGNFMTIDGSELPFCNAQSGSGTIGFSQSFEIVSVQIGIFMYSVRNTAIGITNNNDFSINNLVLKGNTSTPYVDFSGTPEEIEIQERLMSRNSGGYTGIIIANGASSFTNMYVFNTVIAITNNAYGYNSNMEPTYVMIDYMKTDNNWANTFYLHSGSGWIIKNSEIGQSGGSAIHMVDFLPAVFDEYYDEISNPTPYLELHDSTTINNWISGEEAWFKAYGMSQVALTLKSGIENGISQTGRSIIDLVTDPLSGLETEMINFILLTEPASGADVYQDPEQLNQIGGSEFSIKLGDYETNRPFNFFSTNVDDTYFPFPDQRIISNQFAFPIGDYTEFPAFYQLIADLRGMGVSEADAPNLASLGAFYGLTALETANTMGYAQAYSITFREALSTTVPGKTFPKYIEVLAPVPVFPSGFSTVIIQFSDSE